jgi:hypothetical protein
MHLPHARTFLARCNKAFGLDPKVGERTCIMLPQAIYAQARFAEAAWSKSGAAARLFCHGADLYACKR